MFMRPHRAAKQTEGLYGGVKRRPKTPLWRNPWAVGATITAVTAAGFLAYNVWGNGDAPNFDEALLPRDPVPEATRTRTPVNPNPASTTPAFPATPDIAENVDADNLGLELVELPNYFSPISNSNGSKSDPMPEDFSQVVNGAVFSFEEYLKSSEFGGVEALKNLSFEYSCDGDLCFALFSGDHLFDIVPGLQITYLEWLQYEFGNLADPMSNYFDALNTEGDSPSFGFWYLPSRSSDLEKNRFLTTLAGVGNDEKFTLGRSHITDATNFNSTWDFRLPKPKPPEFYFSMAMGSDPLPAAISTSLVNFCRTYCRGEVSFGYSLENEKTSILFVAPERSIDPDNLVLKFAEALGVDPKNIQLESWVITPGNTTFVLTNSGSPQ